MGAGAKVRTAIAVGFALLCTACAPSTTPVPPPSTLASSLSASPTPSGPPLFGWVGWVSEKNPTTGTPSGSAAMLCDTWTRSDPPVCQEELPLRGWTWQTGAGIAPESRRYAEVRLVGTYADGAFTLQPGGSPLQPVLKPSPARRLTCDFTQPSRVALEGQPGARAATTVEVTAKARPETLTTWFDVSATVTATPGNAPTLNVLVQADPHGVGQQLASIWTGGLCIGTAPPREAAAWRDRAAIAQLARVDVAQVFASDGHLIVRVWADPGDVLQATLNETYGDGAVQVRSRLIPQ